MIASSDGYTNQADLVVTNEQAYELSEVSVIIEP